MTGRDHDRQCLEMPPFGLPAFGCFFRTAASICIPKSVLFAFGSQFTVLAFNVSTCSGLHSSCRMIRCRSSWIPRVSPVPGCIGPAGLRPIAALVWLEKMSVSFARKMVHARLAFPQFGFVVGIPTLANHTIVSPVIACSPMPAALASRCGNRGSSGIRPSLRYTTFCGSRDLISSVQHLLEGREVWNRKRRIASLFGFQE